MLFRTICEKGERERQELVRSNPVGGTLPELVLEERIAADTILTLAARLRVDGIVMGTHGGRGYDRLVLGPDVRNGTGLAMDGDGNIYVTNPQFNQLQVFSHSGEFLYDLGESGTG